MFPGANALASAPNAAVAENLLSATGTAQFVATAGLLAGSQVGQGTSPVLASASDHISMSVSYLNPLVNASLTSIKLTVN